jgi:hypothetical protein
MRLIGEELIKKSRRVMKAVAEINLRHGRGTVRFGVALTRAGRKRNSCAARGATRHALTKFSWSLEDGHSRVAG